MKMNSVTVKLPPYLAKLVGSYAKDHGVSKIKFLEHALTLETFYSVLEEASDMLTFIESRDEPTVPFEEVMKTKKKRKRG